MTHKVILNWTHNIISRIVFTKKSTTSHRLVCRCTYKIDHYTLESDLNIAAHQSTNNVVASTGSSSSRHRTLTSRAAHYNPRLPPFVAPFEQNAIHKLRVSSSASIIPGMLSGQAPLTTPTNKCQQVPNYGKSTTKDGDVVIASYFVQNTRGRTG